MAGIEAQIPASIMGNDGEPNGKESGQCHGHWVYIGLYRACDCKKCPTQKSKWAKFCYSNCLR